MAWFALGQGYLTVHTIIKLTVRFITLFKCKALNGATDFKVYWRYTTIPPSLLVHLDQVKGSLMSERLVYLWFQLPAYITPDNKFLCEAIFFFFYKEVRVEYFAQCQLLSITWLDNTKSLLTIWLQSSILFTNSFQASYSCNWHTI